ncbi:MAG: hypothetical protein JSR41_02225 [Proteobacteria bacterium]|nr:hypothetical protein [Pseudomonadota bacterium]
MREHKMRRLCLFAGFSAVNHVDDYVVHYLRELSKFSDVYYQAANDLDEAELAKLDGVTLGRWAESHPKYDFGSWQKLLFRFGWKEVEKYDALILANDSNYGPVRDLGGLFEQMEKSDADFWGITENYGHARHLQSYFLEFNRAVFTSRAFRDFFESIAVEASKQDICLKYEVGLSQLLTRCGFSFKAYVDRSNTEVPIGADVSRHQNTLLEAGSPFLKRKIYSEFGFAQEDLAQTRTLLEGLNYPLDWIPAAPLPILSAEGALPMLAPAEELLAPGSPSVDVVGVQGRHPLRSMVKRMLRPVYLPIKARVIDKLVMLDQRVAGLAQETGKVGERVVGLQQHAAAVADHVVAMTSVLSKLTERFAAVEDLARRIEAHSTQTYDHLAGVQSDNQMRLAELRSDNEARLADLQTSVAELHGHIDWVQRDILIAMVSRLDFSKSRGFQCVTDYPVAYDSPDHLHPVGTVLDHTRQPRFIRACEDYFGAGKQLSFLDIGCSAGGVVWDAVLRGHIGIGLEGSDVSRLQQRAEWRLLRDSLFTCDVTRPFELGQGGSSPFQFDVISAWEVLEHLTREGVDGLFANLARHTHPGSVFACSISQVGGGFTEDGVPLHQTLEPLPWWQERAARHGFEVLDSEAFARLDFARGNGNPSVYYRPEHSYREKEGDCFLVVFLRR